MALIHQIILHNLIALTMFGICELYTIIDISDSVVNYGIVCCQYTVIDVTQDRSVAT